MKSTKIEISSRNKNKTTLSHIFGPFLYSTDSFYTFPHRPWSSPSRPTRRWWCPQRWPASCSWTPCWVRSWSLSTGPPTPSPALGRCPLPQRASRLTFSSLMTLTWHPATLKEVSGCLENYITHLKNIIFVKRVAVVTCNIHADFFQLSIRNIQLCLRKIPVHLSWMLYISFSFTRFIFIINYLEGK